MTQPRRSDTPAGAAVNEERYVLPFGRDADRDGLPDPMTDTPPVDAQTAVNLERADYPELTDEPVDAQPVEPLTAIEETRRRMGRLDAWGTADGRSVIVPIEAIEQLLADRAGEEPRAHLERAYEELQDRYLALIAVREAVADEPWSFNPDQGAWRKIDPDLAAAIDALDRLDAALHATATEEPKDV